MDYDMKHIIESVELES